MLFYCLKFREKTESEKTKVLKTKNESIMLVSKFSVCCSKNLKFVKEQEVKGLLSKMTAVRKPFLSN